MFQAFAKTDYKKMACLHALAIFFVALDRYLKVWATATKPASDKLLALNYSLNPALSFSLPLDAFFILSLSGLIIIWLWFFYFKLIKAGAWLSGIIFTLLLGSLSNFFDRAVYGGVIDYFNFGSLTVFNLADVLIIFSLGVWLFWEIRNSNRPTAVFK